MPNMTQQIILKNCSVQKTAPKSIKYWRNDGLF